MPNTRQNLADALKRVKSNALGNVVRGADIERRDRTLLQQGGFLVEIIRGWYALCSPNSDTGDTSFWHAHFWGFVSTYLRHRFQESYCLSAEASLDLWAGNTRTPDQLIIMTSHGGSSVLQFPNKVSLLVYADAKNLPAETMQMNGVRTMPLALALTRVGPSYFLKSPIDAEICLRQCRPEEIARTLLELTDNQAAAGRLIAAYRHCGFHSEADRLRQTLELAGYLINENNPFEKPSQLVPGLVFRSPYVARLNTLWSEMSPVVAGIIPKPPAKVAVADYLARVRESYTRDAYHSLSIEGYQVSPELIQRIEQGQWDPASTAIDTSQSNALAAKGYQLAFEKVLDSVRIILEGADAVTILRDQHGSWFQSLFSPSVRAGLLAPYDLAGYRNRSVYIKGSRHAPPAHEVVPDLMECFFELLSDETSPAVRAVLGHFFFVYIHPYMDGNGRIARFLMNALFAAAGHPWTIIHVENRSTYMSSLEQASVHRNIEPFARFVVSEMEK